MRYCNQNELLHHYYQCFQTIFYLFKKWCNQSKWLHHYFQIVLNMFRTWCNQNKLLRHFCQCFQTSFYLFKRWCDQNKWLHHYFQTVLNKFQIWCNQYKLLQHYFHLALADLVHHFFHGWPGLAWANDYWITFFNAYKTLTRFFFKIFQKVPRDKGLLRTAILAVKKHIVNTSFGHLVFGHSWWNEADTRIGYS